LTIEILGTEITYVTISNYRERKASWPLKHWNKPSSRAATPFVLATKCMYNRGGRPFTSCSRPRQNTRYCQYAIPGYCAFRTPVGVLHPITGTLSPAKVFSVRSGLHPKKNDLKYRFRLCSASIGHSNNRAGQLTLSVTVFAGALYFLQGFEKKARSKQSVATQTPGKVFILPSVAVKIKPMPGNPRYYNLIVGYVNGKPSPGWPCADEYDGTPPARKPPPAVGCPWPPHRL